jgi:Zn ribbon nucleic-acid-binding protein
MAKKLHQSCPNCDAQWGVEEISFQECDSCGYPDCDDEDDEDLDDEPYDEYEYEY